MDLNGMIALVTGAAAMRFLADDSLAGRIMLCRQGGEPPRLLPVTDGQE